MVMDKEEYEGLQETLHLLSSPANAAHLMESIKQAEQSKVIAFEPFE